MTGCFTRLSDSPPKVATSGRFPSRGMVSFRHVRGPSGVCKVPWRRLASFITLVWFFPARLLIHEIPFALCVHDVLGYVQPDFAIDGSSSLVVELVGPVHNTDFVAEKPCFARVGMRHQRFCG